ncbi:MAG: isoaspartyl peptidase/L-asparaginase, partial [Ktedonobacterales bacterium]
MGLALIVHGGAGAIARDRYDAAREGCRAAALVGWRALLAGGSALDAAQAAIASLEDNPGFNAGTGAVLTSDGRAQLDAGIMDGTTLNAGAIAGAERIKNPIMVARQVLASPHVLLMGAGAEQFAVESGIALCDPSELVTPTQYARWRAGYSAGDDVHVGTDDPSNDV